MKILKKLLCVILLLFQGTTYKFGGQKIPFWHWLYGKMIRKNKYSFIDGCYIKFLFIDACNRSFSEGICNVYESLRPGISERELSSRDLIKVFNASIEEKNKNVADRVITIVDRLPNYFPNNFKEKYNDIYQNTFNKGDRSI